ncbi:MAG: adenosine kinase [Myxococcota bacterium]
MDWHVVGIGNALMDALVILDDDGLLKELELHRGTMHPVDHGQWQAAFERVRNLDVIFDSGGSCANTIATVGRLGGKARYCGQVGEDQMGHEYAAHITKACGGHALRFLEGGNTGKCLSIISRSDAERTMLTDLGASVLMNELGDFGTEIAKAQVAHFTGYTLLDGPTQPVVWQAMGIAKEHGVKVSIDAADPFVIGAIRDRFSEALRTFADIAFLNAEEARALTGLDDAEAAARHVAEDYGVATVAVKCGKDGSVIVHNGEVHHVAVRPVDAIDTTGAGDAYAGGFLYGLATGTSIDAAGRLASAVAGLTVAQVGAVVHDTDALATLKAELS